MSIHKISHRGNTVGREKQENNPEHVKKISKFYYVEIDVWYENDNFWLGHDFPLHKVDLKFLKNKKYFCHAKNIEALHIMLKERIHCFWHENDKVTLTSLGYVWKYPEVYKDGKLWGICSDWL